MVDENTRPSFLNLIPDLKRSIRNAIKSSGISREIIVDHMNEMLEIEGKSHSMSPSILNSWTKNEEARIPSIDLLSIFCAVTNSLEPMSAIVKPLGAHVIRGQELQLVELGQAEIMKREARRREHLALMRLGVCEPMIEEEKE